MPLMKCPACDKDVSASAQSCPQCGHPFKAPQEPKGEGLFLQTMNCGCMATFAVIIILFVLFIVAMGIPTPK